MDLESGESYLTWESERGSFYQRIEDLDIKAQWEEIGTPLHGFPVCRECFCFIHKDPHIWNLRVDGYRLILLDFDVGPPHWFANDIAITCQHVLTMLSGGLTMPLHHPERLVPCQTRAGVALEGDDHDLAVTVSENVINNGYSGGIHGLMWLSSAK